MDLTTHRLPGLVLTDHEFTVPLDHADQNGEGITVFAREVVVPDKEDDELPWLVFFQGGPGFGSPRPGSRNGWLKRALKEYRVLLLDQRGTGRSSPVTHQTLARFPSPQAQADYLKHFRADAIVKDAEWIRKDLVGKDAPWSGLGQSYGGFCLTTYLSFAPDGLKEAILTGGLPSIERPADEVYRAAYPRVNEKNERYFERYPGDAQRAREIVDYLGTREVKLPNGERLSSRRFQQLGFSFGASDGFESVHYLLEGAFVEGPSGRELSHGFLRGFENALSFDTNPIYAILHESIYCQQNASNWSAQRMRAEFPQFDRALGKPALFTGEMIYPWMFDELEPLKPLKEAAEILATYNGWPRLYDPNALRENTVPCVAAVYYNDMYVDRVQSEETAQNIKGIKLWVTNQYEHNGLRSDGEDVLGRLLDMLHGEA